LNHRLKFCQILPAEFERVAVDTKRRETDIALNRCAVGSQRITPSPKFYRVSERH
jgi:hypothetical protein